MRGVLIAALLPLAACAAAAGAAEPAPAPPPPAARAEAEETKPPLLPAPTVTAKGETDPVATADDAADDPAIWRNATDPKASLVIGTDKKAGIHVYGLDGKRKSFTPAARLNNVDLRDGVRIAGKPSVFVAASDRSDVASARIALFSLDTRAAVLKPIGSVPVGAGEAYGMCLWKRKADGALFGFVVLKDGRIDQVQFDTRTATPTGTVVRTLKVATQAEGCVADDRTGRLYVAEEDVGIWGFLADPAAPTKATPFAKVDDNMLFADAEGLALAPVKDSQGYLVVSSQGDNAYAVYDIENGDPLARFRIADGKTDGTSETDGIELLVGDFGPDFPKGLFVAQDGDNAPDTQNFKYVSWADVIDLLDLKY